VFRCGSSSFQVKACALVHTVLRDGGLWINFGPLLYHGKSTSALEAPQLAADELVLLVQRSGFEMLSEGDKECQYGQDPLSMCRSEYRALFFVARKVPLTAGT